MSRKPLSKDVLKQFVKDPDSLDPLEFDPEHKHTSTNNLVALEKIRLPLRQPRRYFDSEKIESLAQSIREHGILEPLLVRPLQSGEYELVAGERRYRAAQLIDLKEVPISIHELSDQNALEIALIENLQREDLNPVEETEGILDLLSLRMTISRQEIIALLNRAAHAKKRQIEVTNNVIRNQLEEIEKIFAAIGTITPASFRTNRLPLLNLPSEILETLRQGKLEYTKAKTIAQIKDKEQRQKLMEEVIEGKLSLSKIRDRIKQLQQPSTNDTSSDLSYRFRAASRRLEKSKVWTDPKKKKRLERLLHELEALSEE